MDETLTVIFSDLQSNKEYDLEIPLYITADELIRALNISLKLGIDMDEIDQCFFRTENPITLLRGDKILRDYNLRTGTKICYQRKSK